MGVLVHQNVGANAVILAGVLAQARLAQSGAGRLATKPTKTLIGGAFVIAPAGISLMLLVGACGVVTPSTLGGVAISVGGAIGFAACIFAGV